MGALERLCTIVAVFFVLGYYSFAANVFATPETNLQHINNPLKPLYLHLLAVITASAVVGWGLFDLRGGRRLPLAPLFILAYLLLIVVQFSLGAHNDVADKAVLFRSIACVVTLCFFVIFSRVRSTEAIIVALRAVIVFTCVVNVIQLALPRLIPLPAAPYSGRSFGFYENPNVSALFTAAAVPLACLGARRSVQALIVLLSFISILTTFSREGILIWAGAVAMMYILPERSKPGIPVQGVAAGLVIALMLAIVLLFAEQLRAALAGALAPFVTTNTLARILGQRDFSTLERIYVAQRGMEAFASSPLFGLGPGYTWNWGYNVSVHNMVVLLLAEHGLVGLMIYIGWIVAVGRFAWPYGLWAAVLLLMMTPFSHNLFDSPNYTLIPSLYWLLSVRVNKRASLGRDSLHHTHQLRPGGRLMGQREREKFESNSPGSGAKLVP